MKGFPGKLADSPRQELLTDAERHDSADATDLAVAQRKQAFITGAMIKHAAIVGVGVFVHVASVWYFFAAQRSFNNWGQAAVAENSALDMGGCENFPDFMEFLRGKDFQNICPDQPIASSLVLGIASVAAEMNHMWMPSVFLVPAAAIASPLITMVAVKLYAGTNRSRQYQQRLRNANELLKKAADAMMHVLRMAYFSTVEVWLPVAKPTVETRFVDGANGMAKALMLQVNQGTDANPNWVDYPSIQSFWQVVKKWTHLDKFDADSYFSQVQRYVGKDKMYFMSKPFTGAVTLSAGAFYAWMYVLSGGMVAFNVGLLAGWLAVVGKVCLDTSRQQQLVLPTTTAAINKVTPSKVAATVLRPFSFLSEVIEQQGEPTSVAARTYACLHKLTNVVSMVSIGVVVSKLALNVGNVLSKEFFGEDADGFLSIIWKALWNNKVLDASDASAILNKENTATLFSMSFASETLVGLEIYMTAACVMLALTLLYATYRAAQSCKKIKPSAAPAAVKPQSRIGLCCQRAGQAAKTVGTIGEAALLEGARINGHDVFDYAVKGVMLALVVTTLVIHAGQLRSNVGHACPTSSFADLYHLLVDREGTVYPGSPNCTDTVRGQASVESTAISWPFFALGGNSMVAMIGSVSFLVGLIAHGYQQYRASRPVVSGSNDGYVEAPDGLSPGSTVPSR